MSSVSVDCPGRVSMIFGYRVNQRKKKSSPGVRDAALLLNCHTLLMAGLYPIDISPYVRIMPLIPFYMWYNHRFC